MSRLKIIADDNIPFLKGRLEPIADVVYADQFGFTPELVRNADALLIRTRTLCNEALLGGSSVKAIATATIGVDQIDIPWCHAHGIAVRNAPGCNAPGVAQYVWSALLRKGVRPETHRIGIVGHGNVGSVVATWGESMGFDIMLCDPPVRDRLTDAGDNEQASRYHDLETLLRECDVVTFHTPLTRSGLYPTYHLFDLPEASLMRRGQILINAARGPVAANEALLAAHDKGVSLIIDTWEGEPDIDLRVLEAADIATFHIAGYSHEGKQRATRMALEALSDMLGINPDTSGLASAPQPGQNISPEAIIASYDPQTDDAALRDTPAAFDDLRANYNYRHEPAFPPVQSLS